MRYDFLNDKSFLDKIDRLRTKEQFLKMTILSWDENVVTEIQGVVTSGSLSLSGTSSLRRTGSFDLYADKEYNNLENIDHIVAINRKVMLELGVKNTVSAEEFLKSNVDTGLIESVVVNYQEKYGEVIWFPLGIYVMFDPTISHTSTGINISVSCRDKMCLLNGDAGGVIPAAVTFSESEYDDEDGNTIVEHPTIYQIIYECVNHFGNENPAKIVISDLDLEIKQPMQYTAKGGIYYVTNTPKSLGIRFYLTESAALAAARSAGGDQNNIVFYETGTDIGYAMTDFIYPGELTCNPGATVTEILDKIITLLGNFEYFYDVYGVFHFQEIKNYLNTSYSTNILEELNTSPSYEADFSRDTSVYTFNGTELILSISNAPQYSNVKNDFVVWGERTAADDTKLPIRYHVAIDKRPVIIGSDSIGSYYGVHTNIILKEDEYGILRATKATSGGVTIYTRDYREELYYQGVEAVATGTDAPYYYTELSNEWPKLYYLAPRSAANQEGQRFRDTVKAAVADMDFYLDIIDIGSEVGRYSVDNIGRRSFVVQENEINCIFEPDTPDMVFINKDEYEGRESELEALKDKYNAAGQGWNQLDNTLNENLTMGGVRNSAYYRVTELLYQYTNMNNTININCLPLFYLEPNTRISVYDELAGVYGDFVIQTISVPLVAGGTMDISAYKAQQKI